MLAKLYERDCRPMERRSEGLGPELRRATPRVRVELDLPLDWAQLRARR